MLSNPSKSLCIVLFVVYGIAFVASNPLVPCERHSQCGLGLCSGGFCSSACTSRSVLTQSDGTQIGYCLFNDFSRSKNYADSRATCASYGLQLVQVRSEAKRAEVYYFARGFGSMKNFWMDVTCDNTVHTDEECHQDLSLWKYPDGSSINDAPFNGLSMTAEGVIGGASVGQNCVTWVKATQAWRVDDCGRTRAYDTLCEAIYLYDLLPSATPSLSLAPSSSPSDEPSAPPSVSTGPSDAPSREPSETPTLSISPSDRPSRSPSESPSKSASPSSSPSSSVAPTPNPPTCVEHSDCDFDVEGKICSGDGYCRDCGPSATAIIVPGSSGRIFAYCWFGPQGVGSTFDQSQERCNGLPGMMMAQVRSPEEKLAIQVDPNLGFSDFWLDLTCYQTAGMAGFCRYRPEAWTYPDGSSVLDAGLLLDSYWWWEEGRGCAFKYDHRYYGYGADIWCDDTFYFTTLCEPQYDYNLEPSQSPSTSPPTTSDVPSASPSTSLAPTDYPPSCILHSDCDYAGKGEICAGDGYCRDCGPSATAVVVPGDSGRLFGYCWYGQGETASFDQSQELCNGLQGMMMAQVRSSEEQVAIQTDLDLASSTFWIDLRCDQTADMEGFCHQQPDAWTYPDGNSALDSGLPLDLEYCTDWGEGRGCAFKYGNTYYGYGDPWCDDTRWFGTLCEPLYLYDLEPSQSPSTFPPTASVAPSALPSIVPSGVPSSSALPSVSVHPSVVPTLSIQPSVNPSSSHEPSSLPSLTSSATPTLSHKPSTLPSLSPTDTPTSSMNPSTAPVLLECREQADCDSSTLCNQGFCRSCGPLAEVRKWQGSSGQIFAFCWFGLDNRGPFDQARQQCEAMGMTMLQVRTEEKNNVIATNLGSLPFWIDIRCDNTVHTDEACQRDLSLWQYPDGTSMTDAPFQNMKILNGVIEGGRTGENCAHWWTEIQWGVHYCHNDVYYSTLCEPTYLYETEPSPSPSSAPSSAPSESPSLTHSVPPTVSMSPSNAPSVLPSRSASPSVHASSHPSGSMRPTGQPSSAPSGVPSSLPSGIPTLSMGPTQEPTRSPSASAVPSLGPTTSPSSSQSPSREHSGVPTLSAVPTAKASDAPSGSINPSGQPSAIPSSVPSMSPTLVPSLAPSASPSSIPSSSPTLVPSLAPSASPSSIPSASPTHGPSRAPSASPSAAPSSSPTLVPSQSPSTNPSVSPTSTPSHQPSGTPTSAPVNIPRDGPWENIFIETFAQGTWGGSVFAGGDGGSDAAITTRGPSYVGDYTLRLRDNTSSSVATTTTIPLSSYDEVRLSFRFQTRNVLPNEEFVVRYRTSLSSPSWTEERFMIGTVEWPANRAWYLITLPVVDVVGATNVQFQFQSYFDSNRQKLHLDELVLDGRASITI